MDKLTPKDIGRFDDTDMSYLAEKLSEAYLNHDFWIDLEILSKYVLEEK